MKKFKEFITEVFDKPAKWKWKVKNKNDEYMAQFDVEKETYEVYITKEVIGAKDEWSIEFDIKNGIEYYGDTGKHHALRVLSTVMDIISKFASIQDPKIVTFSGDKKEFSGTKGTDRAKVYNILLKRKLPKNYTYEVIDRGPYVNFTIIKK